LYGLGYYPKTLLCFYRIILDEMRKKLRQMIKVSKSIDKNRALKLGGRSSSR
jgi:hypothetical protein